MTGAAHAAPIAPNLKVLICTGDYGYYAQDGVPIIENAVGKAALNSEVFWEAHQYYKFAKVLKNPGYVSQLDAIVIGDIGIWGDVFIFDGGG